MYLPLNFILFNLILIYSFVVLIAPYIRKDVQKVWNILKDIRINYLLKYEQIDENLGGFCNSEDTLLSEMHMDSNFYSIQDMLQRFSKNHDIKIKLLSI